MSVKRLPKKRKHIPKHRDPVGTVKNGRVKIQDGDTGKVSWRQSKSGFLRSVDGEPTSKRYQYSQMKKKPTHKVHMGHKRKSAEQRKQAERSREE